MISPCVDALRRLARNFNDILGADVGKRHTPPDLTNDIETLMDSLEDHKVFTIQKGRVLGGESKPVPDVVSVGLQSLTNPDGSKNPLTDYNNAFKRLKRRRGMTPVALPTDLPPTSMTGLRMTSLSQPSNTNIIESSTNTCQIPNQDPQIVYDSHTNEVDDTVENTLDFLEELESADEVQLPCLTAADVAFDMDNDFIEDGEEYISDSEESECSEMEEDNEEEGDCDDTVVL